MKPPTQITAISDERALLQRRITSAIVIVTLIFASLIVLLPILWAWSTSLRLPKDSFAMPPQWLPTDWRWQNYADVFAQVPFGQYILNSLKVTILTVAGQLATSTLAAYAFARLRFPGKNILFVMLMSALMIPLFATIIPIFVIIRNLGLADTHEALILPALVTPFGIFLMRQFFLTIPTELEDAAKLDGAGPFRIFWHIFLPLGLPGIAVLSVLSFNTHWNEYFRPLIFLNSWEKFTIPLGIVNLIGPASQGSTYLVLAGVMISLIPVVVLILFAQRYLVEGIILTGSKG
ncbi:MAG: carbohydrate ABC transporter permease [Anaerolineae bacterium]|nr:carbohydrate ABC transporter permease [Anaerolineae bacterium]